MVYSETLMDCFLNPTHGGVMENADGVGHAGGGKCGDVLTFYVRVKHGTITRVRYEAYGCAPALASAEMGAKLLEGQPVDTDLSDWDVRVEQALGGLPPEKSHCPRLVREGLQEAIQDYRSHKHKKAK